MVLHAAQFRMKNKPKISSNLVPVQFILVSDKFAEDSRRTCGCGNRDFSEAHRIERVHGPSIMYECTACGEYTL
jgi:hypothetical protein